MIRTATRRVVVTIDRLVLKGVRYEDRHDFSQGLREQLAQVFSEPGLVERLRETGSISRLRVGPVTTSAEAKPRQNGIATANGIGKGLNR